MHQGASMPREDAEPRMRRMREVVAENNVYRWAAKIAGGAEVRFHGF